MKQKKLFVLLTFIGAVAGAGWAQFLADPNDNIYRLLSIWEQKGYVDFLPSVRPYPPQFVRQALLKVQERGNKRDVELALQFLAGIGAETPSIPVEISGTQDNQVKNVDYKGLVYLGVQSTGSLTDKIGYSARGRLFVEKLAEENVYPRWTDDYDSTISTEAKFMGQKRFDLGDYNFNSYGAFDGAFFFGTDRLYAQVGLIRTSFGPFIESPVLGPQAPLAGHFSFTYQTDRIALSIVYLELKADYGVTIDGQVYSLKGTTTFFPSKHLILHSVNLRPWSWLDLELFQTAVFGARLSPIYLFPFVQYVQNYFGDWDNAFLGVSAQLDFPLDIQYKMLLYVDDINLTEMFKFNFNSNQNRIALKSGLSWIAPFAVPNKIDFTYLMITPYMYTHYSKTLTNYLQYTHHGQHLGSVLAPNSDQWHLSMIFLPAKWMHLNAWAGRIRHGNGSDYGEGSIDGDGSIFDDGLLPDGTISYTGPSSFLIQDVLEKVWQIGLNADFQWNIGNINTLLKAGYTLEYVQNKDLNPDTPDEANHYFHVGLTLIY